VLLYEDRYFAMGGLTVADGVCFGIAHKPFGPDKIQPHIEMVSMKSTSSRLSDRTTNKKVTRTGDSRPTVVAKARFILPRWNDSNPSTDLAWRAQAGWTGKCEMEAERGGE
jgi:hypothetical protein